jgi:hypothetical protein
MEMGGKHHVPAAFSPGKNPDSQRLGGPHSRFGGVLLMVVNYTVQ